MTVFSDFNLKFPIIWATSVFMSSLNFMLSRVKHEKSFITLRPGVLWKLATTIDLNQWRARWPVGRASDSGSRGRVFVPH